MKTKMLFTTIFLTFNFFLLPIFSLAQWDKQPLIPEDAFFNDIFFLDQDHGWCVGDNSAHYSTTNGGYTWELMDSLIATYIDNVHFTDQNNGWVGGFEGIWHTNNGGHGTSGNWVQQWNLDFLISATPFFIDSLNGWSTVYFHGGFDPNASAILRTVDGGSNWTFETSTFWGRLSDITYTDSQHGWAVGALSESYGCWNPFDYTTVIHTSDGGQNWDSLYGNYNDIPLNSVCFIDSLNGWTTGAYYSTPNPYGLIYHTLDGGITWDQQGDTVPPLNEIIFVDNLYGWAVGDAGTILHTSDGGLNWELQESGTLANLTSISFVNQEFGWICGDSGVILHTNNGGLVGLDEIIKLENNLKIYPNPTNQKATIEFNLQNPEFVSLSIHNVLGQEITNLFSDQLNAGTHKIEWTAKELDEGIYFCVLKTNQGLQTTKIIKH